MTARPGVPGLHLYLAMHPNDSHLAPKVNRWPEIVAGQPIKWLCSYHYFRQSDMDELVAGYDAKPQIFADSGAFSAYNVGAEVKVDDYAAWLKRWAHLIDVYVNLDVIRDPKGTAANQRRLESLGLAPIPVFHTGSPWPILDELAARYPYVALGGMVGSSAAVALKWTATAFARVADHGTQFHGFGQTRREVISELPWYSVDSSSWGKGHRYGHVDVWLGNKMATVTVGDKIRDPRIRAALRSAGVRPEQIDDRAHYQRAHAITAASSAWRQFEGSLRRRHGPINLRAAS